MDPRSGWTAAQDPAYFRFVGRAIRVLRTERGLERKELAARSGLSYAYLAEIEGGKKRASSQALLAIAEALGVRPHEVLAAAEALARREAPAEAEPDPAPARGPLSSESTRPPRAPARFFHESSGPEFERAERLSEPEWSPEATGRAAPPPSVEAALTELRRRLERMAPDDVARLLDLARRLSSDRRR